MTELEPETPRSHTIGIWPLVHAEWAALAAEYYQGSGLPVLTRTRIKGLRLVATDGPFTIGSGPLVSGTALALIMAMAGRGRTATNSRATARRS